MKTNKLLILSSLVVLALTGCNKQGTNDNDKYDYVFLAQPAVTAVLKAKNEFSLYSNVQNDYKAKSNNLEITQASIFVKGDLEKSKVDAFLSMINSEVTSLLDDPQNVLPRATQGIDAQLITGKIGGQVSLISTLLASGNSLGIGYKDALNNKAAIDAFIGTIGLSASKDSDYYQREEVDPSSSLELNVACPAGAPAIAFYNHLTDSKLEVAAADTVLAYLSENTSKDIVIAPTNAGLNAINSGVNFKLAATITFGNFFIISTGNDDDNTLNKGDKVLAFQQKGVPGKIFEYVYGDKDLDVTFAKDAAAAKDEILLQK